MVTRVQKWGNSQRGFDSQSKCSRMPGVRIGGEVEVTARDSVILIAPVRQGRGKQSLQDLASRIPNDYNSSAIHWGEPVAKEVW